jgi:hypothetical protein
MKIIRTQGGDLVNFANIIEIFASEGEVQSKGQSTKAYAIIANDTLGKERQLGIYDTETEADNSLKELTVWLAVSNEVLFDFGAIGEENA